MMAYECETTDCTGPQDFAITARWSIVDFGTWYVCSKHAPIAVEWMKTHRPDGHEIKLIEVVQVL